MLVLIAVAVLSGAAAGRTMTAYSLLPTSAAAFAVAVAASDMTAAGILWRVAALVAALQFGFVCGAASIRLTDALERRLGGAQAALFRTRRRGFRSRLRGGAKGGY